jgi:hypothetical protein
LNDDSLLVLFRRLALAGTPLLVGGCLSNNNCPPQSEATTTVSLASLQADAGAADAGAGDGGLDDLCRQAVGYAQILSCKIVTVDGGPAVQVVHTAYCLGGRRPAGLAAPIVAGGSSALGVWLAGTAHLEAASIDAFAIMSSELEAHGAPRALIDRALAAADDERRHARVMTRLARRRGARPPEARVVRQPTRDLETIAAENAVEGCVRETFAALVACRQARAAEDLAVRRAMKGIAVDETRHAALSWAVDAWAGARLSSAARRRTREARRATVEALLGEIAVGEPADLRAAAGLPDGDEAVRMASALFSELG